MTPLEAAVLDRPAAGSSPLRPSPGPAVQFRVLVADDERDVVEAVRLLFSAHDLAVLPATTPAEAVAAARVQPIDAALIDLNYEKGRTNGEQGLDLISAFRRALPGLPIVVMTAWSSIELALEAMRRGAYDYILKPFERDQLLMGVRRALEHRRLIVENRNYQKNLERLVQQRTAELKNALSQLEESYDETLEALGGALDLKDSETEGHCKRVMIFTLEIARAMGIESSRLPQLARAAFLHDIGKMAIPDRILRKPGPLTDDE